MLSAFRSPLADFTDPSDYSRFLQLFFYLTENHVLIGCNFSKGSSEISFEYLMQLQS